MEAAAFGETDVLKGVSENIMLGQLAPIGTGNFELYLDEDKLKDAIELEDPDEYQAAANAAALQSLGPMTPSIGITPVISPGASPSANGAFSPGMDAQFSPGVGDAPGTPFLPYDYSGSDQAGTASNGNE